MSSIIDKLCNKCGVIKKLYLFTKRKVTYQKKKIILDTCYECHYGTSIEGARILFEKKVIKKEGCWDWIGSINKFGYGEMHFQKRHHNAHRIAWMLYKGKIPKKMFVLHKCDNRTCTNLDHLFLGTAQDNMDDMIKKGRNKTLKGSQCPWAKLNEAQVKEIKLLLKQGKGPTFISKLFNVAAQMISDIKNGNRWKHVILED